ncbi:MAG: hypothetical protein IJW28_00560, partial [Clostridia bacterium]|nr:hypothetical protein [Clostridia bacterium]
MALDPKKPISQYTEEELVEFKAHVNAIFNKPSKGKKQDGVTSIFTTTFSTEKINPEEMEYLLKVEKMVHSGATFNDIKDDPRLVKAFTLYMQQRMKENLGKNYNGQIGLPESLRKKSDAEYDKETENIIDIINTRNTARKKAEIQSAQAISRAQKEKEADELTSQMIAMVNAHSKQARQNSAPTIKGAKVSDSGNMVVSKAKRVSADPKSPNYNERFATLVKNRRIAEKTGDMTRVRAIDKVVYAEFGLVRNTSNASTPTTTNTSARTVEHGVVKDAGNPKKNKNHKPARKCSKRALIALILVLLMSLIMACGRSCDSNTGKDFTTGIGIVTMAQGTESPTEDTTTGFYDDTTTISPDDMESVVDLELLKIDMQGPITMSSKGALDLAKSVTMELAELCALAGEDLPKGVNISNLVSTMFTENGLKTQETTIKESDQWVGATQVSEETVGQVMKRAEKFYNTCLKEINKQTDPKVKAVMLAELESNYFIKHFYKTDKSAHEIWKQCVTDAKYAASVAQCVKL